MRKCVLVALLLLLVVPCLAQVADLQPLTLTNTATQTAKVGPIILDDNWEFSLVTGTTVEVDMGVLAGCVSYNIAQTKNGSGMFWVDAGIKFDGADKPDLFVGLSTNLHTKSALNVNTRGIFGYLFSEGRWFLGVRTPLNILF